MNFKKGIPVPDCLAIQNHYLNPQQTLISSCILCCEFIWDIFEVGYIGKRQMSCGKWL